MASKKLGELLVRDNLITPAQLQQALEEQKKKGGRLGANLTRLGFINEEELADFLSKQYEVPSINLSEFEIDPEVIALVPEDQAKKHMLIPINRAGATLVVAMADPSNMFAINDIEFLTGYRVEVVVAPEKSIAEAIERYYQTSSQNLDEMLGDFEDLDISLSGEGEE
jgi:type IV pilus assembly protein PilB